MKRMSTIVLGSVFVLVQYLLIIFCSNQDAKLDMHIQVQSELLCNKRTQRLGGQCAAVFKRLKKIENSHLAYSKPAEETKN